MGNVSKLGKIPPTATSSSPGAVASSLTTALIPTGDSLYVSAAEKAAITTLATNGDVYLRSGTIPAFVANAVTIAPGTDQASYYTLPAATVLAATSALTVATAGPPPTSLMVHITIESPATLGHNLTINNGTDAAVLFTVLTAWTRAVVVHLVWGGTNYSCAGVDWVSVVVGSGAAVASGAAQILVAPTVIGTGQLTGGAYTVTADNSRLQVTATASVPAQINLPAGSSGAACIVVNSGGDPATAQQVTVVPAGSDTILGTISLLLDGRDSVILAYNTITADWEVL
jgi:hypothetical protein